MMLAAIRSLFGGRKVAAPVSDEPPLELQVIISGARIYERASSEEGWDGAPRIMVDSARGAFFADKFDAWLTSGWPTLTDTQRARARSMLKVHIAAWQQRAAGDVAARGRTARNYCRDF
jgi:hypothetical protein